MDKDKKIYLGDKCNNNCIFCAKLRQKASKEKSFQEICDELIIAKKNGDSIIIAGGEPLLRSDFNKIILFAKKIGLRITIETNGRIFQYPQFAEKIKKLGIYEIIIKVISYKKNIHENISRADNSFSQTNKGIKNLLAIRQNVSANILCSPENYKDIELIISFYKQLGIQRFQITLPPSFDSPMQNYYVLNTIPIINKVVKTFPKTNFSFNNLDTALLKEKNKRYPFILYIDTTNVCNLNCAVCSLTLNRAKKRRDISLEEFKGIINQMHNKIHRLHLSPCCEPTLNPNLFKMISHAKQINIENVSLFTNGMQDISNAVTSGLDEIYIALDGATAKTYRTFRRGGNFDTVKNNILKLSNARKKLGKQNPIIFLTFIVTKYNEHEIEEIKNLGKKLGVDYVQLKFIDFGDKFMHLAKDFLPNNLDYSIYKNEKLERKIYNNYSFCPIPWNECVVASDGSVYFCCKYAINKKYPVGNIFKNSFKDIWNNEKYKDFRTKFLNDENRTGICIHCHGRTNRSIIFSIKEGGSKLC